MKIGPKYKIARRLGEPIFPKTQTTKYALSESKKRTTTLKKKKRPRGRSDYGQKLIEKQKVRFSYGLTERALRNQVRQARRFGRQSSPANELFKILEKRLDNVVWRLGLTPSRLAARQMISHGHILVNGRRVNIPSYALRVADKISPRPASLSKGIFSGLQDKFKDQILPPWLKFDVKTMEGELIGDPQPGQFESNLDLNAVLEFYSRV